MKENRVQGDREKNETKKLGKRGKILAPGLVVKEKKQLRRNEFHRLGAYLFFSERTNPVSTMTWQVQDCPLSATKEKK